MINLRKIYCNLMVKFFRKMENKTKRPAVGSIQVS
jgi:hypothetical protein